MRMIFVNLPVTDLERSTAFYGGLGFGFDERFGDERTASVVISESIVVMLLVRERFAEFVGGAGTVGDPVQDVTQLNALSVGSREEADELLSRALAHGGKPWQPAQDHGSMYGTSFTDPDGHVWETVWMDPAQLG